MVDTLWGSEGKTEPQKHGEEKPRGGEGLCEEVSEGR